MQQRHSPIPDGQPTFTADKTTRQIQLANDCHNGASRSDSANASGIRPSRAARVIRIARAGRVPPITEYQASHPAARPAEFGGSIRVVAAIAEQFGLASKSCLLLPLQGLTDKQRAAIGRMVDELGLNS